MAKPGAVTRGGGGRVFIATAILVVVVVVFLPWSDAKGERTRSPHEQTVSSCHDCHTETDWHVMRERPAFDHDQLYFPIYTGEHNGEWESCSDCHVDLDNYGIFSCVTCHEHNRQEMDNEHRDVSAYIYDSLACLSCHPRGNERPSIGRAYDQNRQSRLD